MKFQRKISSREREDTKWISRHSVQRNKGLCGGRVCQSVTYYQDLNRWTDLIFLKLDVGDALKLFTNSDFQSCWPIVNSSLHKIVNEIFNLCYKTLIASVVKWPEFLATDPEVPGSIPSDTRFSEK
jgi:hypothetical protein